MLIQKTVPSKKVTVFKKKLPGCQVCMYCGFSTRCIFFETESCPYDEAIKGIAKAGQLEQPGSNLQ